MKEWEVRPDSRLGLVLEIPDDRGQRHEIIFGAEYANALKLICEANNARRAPSDKVEEIAEREKPSSRPLAHVFMLPNMIKAARSKGYAIALHGSLIRDFDIIAFPWTEEASSVKELVAALKAGSGALELADWEEKVHDNPINKPHGRQAWTIMLGGDYVIDFSVFMGAGIIPMPDGYNIRNAGQSCDMLSGPCSCGSWHRVEDLAKRIAAAIQEALAPLEEDKKALAYDFTPWKPPFKYDDMGTMVVDSESRMIVDVRGWGFLTGRAGGLGLNDDEAAKIQDRLGEHVAKLLNASSVRGNGGQRIS